MDAHPPPPLQARYDAIWESAAPALRAGDADLDLRLAAGDDARRGLTVIARPDAALAARFAQLLDELDALAPGQYRQPEADMHLTILSLFTVCEAYRVQLQRLDGYRDAVASALAGMPLFEIDFRGVSASRGAVLAQGYPRDGTLDAVRERLRGALRERGLDGALDRRYRLVTAHVTLLRFVRPLAQPARLADAIEALRGAPLGTLRVTQMDLVQNDWTMRSAALRRVAHHELNRS